MCDYKPSLDWWVDLFTTSIQNSELQANTAPQHNSQITTAPAKHFAGCCVFTRSSLATAFDSGDPSGSGAQVLSSQSPVKNSSELTLSLAYNTSARTTQKTAFPLLRLDSLPQRCVHRAAA
jgi:hypothetical protein